MENLNWTFLLRLLWSYTNEKVGNWHYPMAEATPRSVLFDADYFQKDMEFLSESQCKELTVLYNSTNEVIQFIINKIFELGTRDLYSSILNNSPDTLKYLQEIIDLMEKNRIPLPPIEPFEKYSISENEGWGREFTKMEIFKEDIN